MVNHKTFNSIQEFLNWKENNPEVNVIETSHEVNENVQNIYQRYDPEANEVGSIKTTITYTD
ncbi:hypothetical protein [Metabacillus litoralis]|uniref:hypothetical protein n=1 Tax=Metabacillus litoralis TaxID=152268 RepID=UPI001CFC7F66|nr:hypothetical protein [Metabacillus litoralis]